MSVIEEKVGSHIPVRIDHIGLTSLAQTTQSVIRDQCQLRIFGLYGIVEHVEAAVVQASPVLVTYFYISQRIRFRMPFLGTQGSPFGVRTADRILNGIQCILQIALSLLVRAGFSRTVLAGQSDIAHIHAFGSYILTEIQEFLVTETIAVMIPPCIILTRTCCRIAQRLFPLHAIVQRDAFYDAAARPAYKGRLQPFYHFCHILTHAVLPTFIGVFREQ